MDAHANDRHYDYDEREEIGPAPVEEGYYAALEQDQGEPDYGDDWAETDLVPDYDFDLNPAPASAVIEEAPVDAEQTEMDQLVVHAGRLARRLGRIIPEDIMIDTGKLGIWIRAAEDELNPRTPAPKPLQVIEGKGAKVVDLGKEKKKRGRPAKPKVTDGDDDVDLSEWMDELIDFAFAGGKRTNQILPIARNARMILENDPRTEGVIALDELAQQIVVTRPVDFRIDRLPGIEARSGKRIMQDADQHLLAEFLQTRRGRGGYGARFTDQEMDRAIVIAGQANKIHPIRDMLRQIEWDGVERMDTALIRYLGVEDNIYYREVSRLIFLGVVGRSMRPGLKCEYLPIIAGKTGSGKSTFVETTACGYLGRLSHDHMRDTARQVEAMSGKALIELTELSAFRGMSEDQIKEFLDRQEDVIRLAYAKRVGSYPRQAFFIGTTERREFLRDKRGNRRMLPIFIGKQFSQFCKIDNPAYEREVHQIMAEALVVFEGMWSEHEAAGRAPEKFSIGMSEGALRIAEQITAGAVVEDYSDTLYTIVDDIMTTPIRLDEATELGKGGVIELNSLLYRRYYCSEQLEEMVGKVIAERDIKTIPLNNLRSQGENSLSEVLQRMGYVQKETNSMRVPGYGKGRKFRRWTVQDAEFMAELADRGLYAPF